MVSLIAGVASSPGLLYGILVPLVLVQLLALLFVPSLLAAPAKARAVAEAVHCYFMQGFGVLLMTVGALPTVFSVLAGVSYTGGTYFGLLLVFAVGGGVFLWQDQRASLLDPAARAVPSAIFFATFRIIGQITFILATLSFLLSVTLGTTYTSGWWVMPVLMAAYGGLIAWCTKGATGAVRSVQSPVGSLFAASAPRPVKAQPPRAAAVAGKKRK